MSATQTVTPSKSMATESIQLNQLAKKSLSTTIRSHERDQASSNGAATESPSHKPTTWTSKIQFSSLCLSLFTLGWSDGTFGPIIPTMQKYYHIGFIVISLQFVFACVGVLTAALLNVFITDRFGFGKIMAAGASCSILAWVAQSTAPLLPLFFAASVLNGLGLALIDAQASAYVAHMANSQARMSIMHAFYGFGGLVSSIVSTQFAAMPGRKWSFHFIISVGMGMINFVTIASVFRFQDQKECMKRSGDEQIGQDHTEDSLVERGKFVRVIRLRPAQLLSLFAFLYIGAAVTTGGWIVSFIIRQRGGGSSSGYVSSGYSGGGALGRVALIWVTNALGPRRATVFYLIAATSLQFIIWFVPSLIANAVAVSFIGFFSGPLFPLMILAASDRVPPHLLTGAIGWITASAVFGGAAFPFATGALASKYGLGTMPPLLLGTTVAMTCVWVFADWQHERKRAA